MTDEKHAQNGKQQGQHHATAHHPPKAIPPVPPGTTFERLVKKALNTPPPHKTGHHPAK